MTKLSDNNIIGFNAVEFLSLYYKVQILVEIKHLMITNITVWVSAFGLLHWKVTILGDNLVFQWKEVDV